MRRFKIDFEAIANNLISNILWVIIGASIPTIYVSVKGIIATARAADSIFFSANNLLLIACFGISLAALIISVILLRRSRTPVPSKHLDGDDDRQDRSGETGSAFPIPFRAKTISAELVFNSRTEMTSSIEYNMEVLSDHISKYNRDLIWSGSEYYGTKLDSPNNDCVLIDSARKRSPFKYTIEFNPEKRRGEMVHFTTVTSVGDKQLEMNPGYSFAVKHQIDKLKLSVVAPQYLLKNVRKAVYADRARELCVVPSVSIPPDRVGGLVRYTYEIQNPTMLYNYFIEWQFTD